MGLSCIRPSASPSLEKNTETAKGDVMATMTDDRAIGPTRPGMMLLDDLRRHAGVAMMIGILMVALGVFALAHVWAATQASVVLIGLLMCAAGAAQLALSFSARQSGWFFFYLLAGVVTIVAGVIAVTRTEIAAVTLTAVLATYLFIDGLYRMFMASAIAPARWGWIMLNGAIEVALGFMLWNQWPASGVFAIGLFVGIDLITVGLTYTMLAASVRRAAGRIEAPTTSR